MPISETQIPWLTLRLAPEMTRLRFYALVDHFQNPGAALGASARELAAVRGFDEQLARKVLEAPRTVPLDRELELMERHGVRLLVIEDDEYPENLRQSSFPPPLLYVRGQLEARDRYSVAMVGSRQATQYGKAVAQQFASRLAACGLAIVSGFARGVDSQAHQSAISAGGRTIAVLGNGLAVRYPSENGALGARIAECGALVTEYPMETPPERYNFPERNHTIAALSMGTLVVEAAEKSGALITANEALEENRFVFAVPGDINRLNSRGTNALIQSGAKLVQRPEEILAEMRHVLRGYLKEDIGEQQRIAGNPDAAPGAPADAPSRPQTPAAPRQNLTDDEKHLLEFIRHEPQYFDVLVTKVDAERFPVQRLSAVLLGLELKRAVKQMPGRLYMALD